MLSPRLSFHRALGGRPAHLLGGHSPPPSDFDHPTYRRCWEFRQQDHAAIGMYKELNPITRLQPEMLTNRFRNGGLSLNSDC